MERIEKDLNDVFIWLRDYMKKYNFKGFVVGLSGGIDSTVSLGIAIRSVGVDNVKCVSLPCTSINEIERLEDQDDADLISKTFGIKTEKIILNDEVNILYDKIYELMNKIENMISINKFYKI